MKGIMKDKAKNFLRRRRTFFACIAAVFVLAYAYCLSEILKKHHLWDVKELRFEALENVPYKFTCPLAYAGNTCRMTGPGIKGIQLRKQIPHAFYAAFLYDLTHRDIMLHVTWITPVFKGQFDSYYEIDAPEIKENLLDFIAEHQEDLNDKELQEWLFVMLVRHREDLAQLGDGDPYVGLERAGVAEWIKKGKDPEAEWRKKFPAGGGAQGK